jgi:hypothetical protein
MHVQTRPVAAVASSISAHDDQVAGGDPIDPPVNVDVAGNRSMKSEGT